MGQAQQAFNLGPAERAADLDRAVGFMPERFQVRILVLVVRRSGWGLA